MTNVRAITDTAIAVFIPTFCHTHARAHARAHARTHARTNARTRARTRQHSFSVIVSILSSPYFLVSSDGIHHLYEVVDTAGKYEFPAMRQMNITNNNAFVVVFAIDDRQSFEEALHIADHINSTKRECRFTNRLR